MKKDIIWYFLAAVVAMTTMALTVEGVCTCDAFSIVTFVLAFAVFMIAWSCSDRCGRKGSNWYEIAEKD